MGRTARKPPEDGGVIQTKDFAGAVRTWRNDIKPALSNSGEAMQEASTGYKHIKKICGIQPQAAKLAFKLDGMEDAKRDDFLRCLTGLLGELKIPLTPSDMVDAMQGDAGAPSGPAAVSSTRAKPKLVTVPMSDGVDADLAGDEPFDASPDELAQQEGRGEPAPGTGAAAIAAMKSAADPDVEP